MKVRLLTWTVISVFFTCGIVAQELPLPAKKTPDIALKSNLLYDMTTTLNLGVEFKTGEKSTLEIPANFNAWAFGGDKRLKHWYVQPELRFWTCEIFNGFFWGIHAHGGQYNVGGLKLPFGMWPSLEEHRYEGYFYGGGLGIGYQWILGNRWNLELGVGAGYTHFEYDKYKCVDCGPKIKSGGRDYIGPDRIALSLIYMIK